MTDKDKAPPVSFLIGRQLDQEKIDYLTKRLESLVSNNNVLRTSAERNEKDTHDIVLYFQREMEMKDDIISRLNEELVKKEGLLFTEIERLKKQHEEEFNIFKKDYVSTLEELRSNLSIAENELARLDSYRRDKEVHDRKLAQLEELLKQTKQESYDALEEQERKFLESKAHLIKELEDQKEAYCATALKEARETVDMEAKKLIIEHKRMSEELKFHNVISSELQTEKSELEKRVAVLKREVGLLTEKEQEYAKQLHYKTREIKALRDRVEQLEKNHMATVERFRLRAKELKGTVHKELEDATLDATGLRRLLKIKNKELKHMKTLAATILQQRSELEQFFLDALSEVKHQIYESKRKSQSETLKQFNQMQSQGIRRYGSGSQVAALPSIKVSKMKYFQEKQPTSNIPQMESDKVYMKDLSWEDKELVLRILFAKMNGLQQNVNSAIRQTKSPTNKKESAVFISEGKGAEEDLMYDDFEIPGYGEVDEPAELQEESVEEDNDPYGFGDAPVGLT